MYLEKDEYDEENLTRSLKDELAEEPGRMILLKGDNSLQFADVAR